MEAVKIAIVGKAREVSQEELDTYNEVWTVGTNPIKADVYFCLHGEQTRHPEKETSWDDLEWLPDAYKGAPIVNSICIMLAVLATMVSAGYCCRAVDCNKLREFGREIGLLCIQSSNAHSFFTVFAKISIKGSSSWRFNFIAVLPTMRREEM